MIHQLVQATREEFLKTWDSGLSASAKLNWDGNYPALGVLDLLLSSTRGASREEAIARKIIHQVSAMVAGYIHDTLEMLGRPIDVSIGSQGIELVGVLDPRSSRRSILPIEEKLADFCSRVPESLPIFKNFSRATLQYGNWLSPLVLGILLGSSGLIDDCETDILPDQLDSFSEATLREVARQCASWYERVYPNEPLGQVAELYLNRLIFPPMYFHEPLPCIHSIAGLLEFQQSFQLTDEQFCTLLANLIHSPDELISATAFVGLAAKWPKELTPEIYGASRRYGAFVGALRGALVECRKILKEGEDWILSDQEYSEPLKQSILRELRLGFIPWFKMPPARALELPEKEQLAFVVQALSEFDIARATVALDKLCEDEPSDIDFRLQHAYMSFISGDQELAMARARALLTEPEAETHPALYNLLGMLQLLNQDATAAADSFTKARTFSASDPSTGAEAANNYAWALMCQEKFDEAIDVIDLSLGLTPDDLIQRLNRIASLLRLNQNAEAEREKAIVLNMAPLHPRVFFAACFQAVVALANQKPEGASVVKQADDFASGKIKFTDLTKDPSSVH